MMVSWRIVFVSVVGSDSVLVSGSLDLSACVLEKTASPDSESEILSVSSQTSQISCCVPQTLSFFGKAWCQWYLGA